jgi:polyhydroxybutyrate depolymerase
MNLRPCALLLAVILAGGTAVAAESRARREWTVDGAQRVALVCAPAKASTNPPPVVFVFHGHGGTMEGAARMFGIHTLWPEAVVVYPQGLNTPGRLTDPEGKRPGWQHSVGAQGDRDLKFFDAMLETMRKDFRVDTNRVYSTGHSNGGGFTYLLWLARGDRLAAIAPSAAAKARTAGTEKPSHPLPVMHIGGTADPLVKFEWQRASMDAVRAFNQCGEGTPWAPMCTQYVSKVGAPLVEYIHPGTHKFPAEAPPLIVRFFREHTRK